MFFSLVWRAFNRAVVKDPEDPRPVPAGMSAVLVISSLLEVIGTLLRASRMMGWEISSTLPTSSS
jgi:hypothetical protein